MVGEAGNVIVTRMTNDFEADVRSRALEQSIATIRNRIDEFGVAEPIITQRRQPNSRPVPRRKRNRAPQGPHWPNGAAHFSDRSRVFERRRHLHGPPTSGPHDEDQTQEEEKSNYTRETFKQLSEYRKRIDEDLKAGLPADTTISFQEEGRERERE